MSKSGNFNTNADDTTVRYKDRSHVSQEDTPDLDSRHKAPINEQGVFPGIVPDNGAGATDKPQQTIEYTEHVSHVIRLRKGMALGALLWPAFSIADFLVDARIQPGILYKLLGLRFATLPIIVLGVLVLYRQRPPSPSVTRLVNVGIFGVASFALASMCVFFEGFESIYFAGILLALVCRGAFVEEHWRAAVLPHAVVVGIYPLVLLGSTLFYEPTAAQLKDPKSMTVFGVYICFILATSVLTGLGSHVIWKLRRQIFETRNIGRYRIKKRLGEGGMGEVWAAHDKTLKRDVAIKILRAQVRRSGTAQTAIARFKREVQATSELIHPNTVRVFDYGVTEDGLWYYAMELLEGEHLGTLIRRQGALPPALAVRLVTQAARALAEAHNAGIVHRDIKPDNLFVANLGGEADFVKILDFGLARLTNASMAENLTATGAVAGTPSYLSPEVVQGRSADSRSDVYALGAVLYTALCGRPPFKGDSASALLLAHVSEIPVSPSRRLGEKLPEDLESVVMRCLEKDPNARYSSAAELAAALALLDLNQIKTSANPSGTSAIE